MRKAISYWAMRSAVSGIAERLRLVRVQGLHAVEHPPRAPPVDAGRVAQIEHRIAAPRTVTPACSAGRKPLLHIRAESAWTFDLLV